MYDLICIKPGGYLISLIYVVIILIYHVPVSVKTRNKMELQSVKYYNKFSDFRFSMQVEDIN